MLSIGKLRPGGAEYYVGEIATSAEDYYLGHGEAPGRWVGSLATEIGLEGAVDPDHFRALLEGRHPFTGEMLVAGRRMTTRTVSVAAEDEWLTVKQAATQLGVSDRYVRRLLASGDVVGEKRRSAVTGRSGWQVQRGHVNLYAVSHRPAKRRPGFDLTLRPPKSVSILWALAPPEQRAAIRQAHREAVDEVVRYYESQAIMARAKGVRIQTAGLVAAAFDHRTSRAGDPLLHTHVVVANLTLTVANTWRALDGRLVFDHSLTGGYLYQAHLRHLLAERLGVRWSPVDKGVADIDGVPQALIDEFSQRRDEIEELLAESGYTSARARQKATLATRNPKDRSVDPDTLATTWRERAAALGFGEREVAACFDRARTVDTPPLDRLYAELAGPFGLTERASTFTRRDVVRELAAALGATATAETVERSADRFLASPAVVLLAGPTSGRNADVVIGLDDRRVRTGGSAVFSTPELLAIEELVLAWSETTRPRPLATTDAIDRALAVRPELSGEQIAMVRSVCSSTEALQPIVGRPGSGKTYATAACIDAIAMSGTPVIGCAVSAMAASELESAVGFAQVTGRPAQTVASLLADLDTRRHRFAPGTAVVVDEASMLGTRDLARLVAHVDAAGGVVKLVGDPDQHTAVDTGGVFRAVAHRRGVDLVRLVANHRQLDQADRDAISLYRDGHIDDALADYDTRGRVVRGDTAPATYDALVRDWRSDRAAGSTAPMLAGTNTARRALNERARALLKTEGVLDGPALVVAGREFMVGDEIVTRRNDRRLAGHHTSAFVKNGSTGTVTAVDTERDRLIVDFDNEGTIVLPSEYLRAGHVEHAYARTTFGVQGATLDRARYHPTDSSRFEEGYVAITRATDHTNLYVVEGDLDIDDDDTGHHAVEADQAGLDVVASALTRRSDQRLAIDRDPHAVEADRLARTTTLHDLRAREAQLRDVFNATPPSASDEIERARRAIRSVLERRDRLDAEKATWRPARRRAASAARATLDRQMEQASHRLERAEAQHEKHDAFMAAHDSELTEHAVIHRAVAARRLKIGLDALADPPDAIIRVLGPRPDSQRDRLGWERAVQAVAIALDAGNRSLPAPAASTAELLGPRPNDLLARFDHDEAVRAVGHHLGHDRERGLGVDIM